MCHFLGFKKNGHKQNRQRYRCLKCNHQWLDGRGGSRIDYRRYYCDWLHQRKTLSNICDSLNISYPTLMSHFDALDWPEGLLVPAPNHGVNLIADATFFGREYGFYCFHDTKRVIWFCEIKTESVAALRRGISELQSAGYKFKSITIDGKRGYVQAIRKLLGGVPIQMCLFHQKSIIRRYITTNPKSLCGQELRSLMNSLGGMPPNEFIREFYQLKHKHNAFLEQRNEKREFQHKNLRAAFRSIQENLPALFTYTDLPEQNIPHTTNQLEGYFSHLKERVKIHRGLQVNRKKKAVRCFLNTF